jgi:hypothetical protein
MKSHPVLVALGTLIFTICALVGLQVWQRFHTLYPTPETKSAFLKSYTPKSVFESFEEAGEGSSYSDHKGGGAGSKFVTHSAGFEWHFAMRSERWMPLMDALRNDVYEQLVASGAEVLNQSGDAHSGFHFEYKLGNSFGAVTISPLRFDSRIHRVPPLSAGLVDADARIEQEETWFPHPPGLITLRVSHNP